MADTVNLVTRAGTGSRVSSSVGQGGAVSTSVAAGSSSSATVENEQTFNTQVSGAVGPQGPPGNDGYTPIKGVDYFDGEDGADGYTPVKGVDYFDGTNGADGKEVELQKSSTHIQWKYDDEVSWTNLVALTDLKGDTGSTGATGATGSTGADGREIELQVTETHIQWRYEEGSWTNLIALSELVGPTGETGATGSTGATGQSAYELAVAEGFVGDETAWLASLVGDTGPQGPAGNDGAGLPTGGTTGQQLVKKSNTDYDYDWETPAGSGDMLASTYDPQNIADDAFDRANHTGTQTASTISDFQTEVSANTDVSANTSKRHDPVTVTDSSEIDFTLTGQDITASLKAGSIDESKLDTSVNASLDLADSSIQPGDDVSDLNNDAGYTTNTGTVTSVAVSGSDGIEVDSGSPVTTNGTIALGVNKTSLLSHINVEDGADVTDSTNVQAALPSGSNGQVLKHNGTSWAAGTDNNTTYSEISEANIENGSSSTVGLITGRRAEALLDNEASKSRTLTNKTLTSPVINTGVSGTAIKDEDDMASNSATHLATQQSIKAYVDAEVAGVTAADVGLGNVDNTSDATKNSASATLTNKTIDGDDNTITDLGTSSLKDGAVTAAKIETQQAWQTMTPTSGSVTTTLGYYKDSLGVVHLRGQLNLSGTGVNFYTLPAGYRPEQYKEFSTASAGLFGVIGISTAGVMTKLVGANGNLDLDVINFRAA